VAELRALSEEEQRLGHPIDTDESWVKDLPELPDDDATIVVFPQVEPSELKK
jgi:hypothetical protein